MTLGLLAASGVHDPIYRLYSRAMPIDHKVVMPVGPTREHTSVVEAIAAADALVFGAERALLVLDPGVYNEQVWTVKNVDIAGATGDPTDVVIAHTCPTGFSPINTTGGPQWIGGVTARLLDYPGRTGSGVYSIHHHGGLLTIFEQVILDGPVTGAIGMDGDEGSETWLIECDWTNAAGNSDLATNMHGSPGNVVPLRLIYDRCLTNGLGVNYSSLSSGALDELYVAGGSVAKVNVQGVGVVAHIDPVVAEVTSAGATVIRDAVLPIRPIRGSKKTLV